MAKRAAGCTRKKIVIKRKGKIVAEFMGRTGKDCGPRPKPKTGHLRHWKSAMAESAKACAGKSRKAFLGCVASSMKRS